MVTIKNLTISFGDETVHKDFSLYVEKGERLAITGESGKGKSTLLNLLAGFIPDYQGEIRVDGTLLSSKTVDKIRTKIAWLPQDTTLTFESVEELFYAPFQFVQNKAKKPTKEEIADIFKAFYISEELLSKKVNEISGGQKQRIILASCLLLDKPLLLIDEPTSALDKAVKERVTDYILNRKDVTIIAVTHDEYWINQSSRVVHLK